MATLTVEKSDLEKLTEFTNNTHWLLNNIAGLRTKYADRYVAVFDSGKKLLDAKTMEELLKKITDDGRDPQASAIEFITRERYLLIV